MHFKPTDQARQRTFASDKTKTVAARTARKERLLRWVERDDGVAGIETEGMDNIKGITAGRDKQWSAGQTQRGLFPPCGIRRYDGRHKAECVTVCP